MQSINRAAIVVRRKQQYFDWARSLDDLPTEPDAGSSIYLVEAAETESPTAIVKRCFPEIFEEQLVSWRRDGQDWPSPRTFALFQEWFDAEIVDLVLDLSNGEIDREDW
jgi:hypothetical protein